MKPCKQIIQDVIATLSGASSLSNVDIICEFPETKRDIPLSKPTVSVGVETVGIVPIEDAVTISQGASPQTVNVKLNVCVPISVSGFQCYDILDRILLKIGDLLEGSRIMKVSVGQMKYSSALNVLITPVNIVFYAGNAY